MMLMLMMMMASFNFLALNRISIEDTIEKKKRNKIIIFISNYQLKINFIFNNKHRSSTNTNYYYY
jgi:hypothetical protein